MVEKVLLMAVAFSQGADDYLDLDLDDKDADGVALAKGVNASNTPKKDGDDYTQLEHQIDEGYGYFGAARAYLKYDDATIKAKSMVLTTTRTVKLISSQSSTLVNQSMLPNATLFQDMMI